MALTPGTRLGVFELTALIGRGGMGEVYQATDTKLKRQVAIKILPASLAADAERMARSQREAEVLASLNHPNIAAIYGLEESAGMTALVMELVEGDDLSQKIEGLRAKGGGPGSGLPIDEALPIAKQIADALEAAHEQTIVHRDLKPANIKVRADGVVKVLDFGLAKAMDPGRVGRGIEPVWRPDGKELYYLSPAGTMMAVPIAVNGTTLSPGAPVALFPTHIVGGGLDETAIRQYDVAPDGRFLINGVLNGRPRRSRC